jgi:hypothetical protein
MRAAFIRQKRCNIDDLCVSVWKKGGKVQENNENVTGENDNNRPAWE